MSLRRAPDVPFVEIPIGVWVVRHHAFDGCKSLVAVTIPDGVVLIGGAFSGCENLETVTIVGSSAFEGCWRLEAAITFSELKMLKDLLPNVYSRIKHVTVCEGTRSIAPRAFDGCLALESLTIPASVTDVGEKAFRNCPNLTTVYLEGDDTRRLCKELSNQMFLIRSTAPWLRKLLAHLAQMPCVTIVTKGR